METTFPIDRIASCPAHVWALQRKINMAKQVFLSPKGIDFLAIVDLCVCAGIICSSCFYIKQSGQIWPCGTQFKRLLVYINCTDIQNVSYFFSCIPFECAEEATWDSGSIRNHCLFHELSYWMFIQFKMFHSTSSSHYMHPFWFFTSLFAWWCLLDWTLCG